VSFHYGGDYLIDQYKELVVSIIFFIWRLLQINLYYSLKSSKQYM
jgi:hypothetical protein